MAKKSNREYQQDALIEDDIKHIHNGLELGEKEMLWNILEGNEKGFGVPYFTPYKQQTDKEIDTEYNERNCFRNFIYEKNVVWVVIE
jgi:hypothetical protein